jgi:hypothetical protein
LRKVIEPTAQVSVVAGHRSRVPHSANLLRATPRPISLTTLSYAAHTCGQKPNDAPKCTRTWVSA